MANPNAKKNVSSQNIEDIFRIRPHALKFISSMAQHFELVIYSSRKRNNVKKMRNILDPEHIYIMDMLYKENCYMTESKKYVKDLSLIQNRSIRDCLILDYKPQSFAFCLGNGIPILHWNGDQTDQELIPGLMEYLVELSNVNDVRKENLKKMSYDSYLPKE